MDGYKYGISIGQDDVQDNLKYNDSDIIHFVFNHWKLSDEQKEEFNSILINRGLL